MPGHLASIPIEEGGLTATDGTFLQYRRVRAVQARAVIVVVHGIGDHQGRYAALESALHAAEFTVYAYDERGHGRSQGPRTDVLRFEEYIDDLGAVNAFVRGREPKGSSLFAYGHSMGSVVTLLH